MNDESVLKGLDLEDPKSIRTVMAALEYRLMHCVLNPSAAELAKLESSQNSLVNSIMIDISATAETHPLLTEAALRFVSSRYQNDGGVIAAAEELETLATAYVLSKPTVDSRAYEEAEMRMEKIRGKTDILRIRQRLPELVCIVNLMLQISTLLTLIGSWRVLCADIRCSTSQ
jgi:hypothetical protein